MKLYCLSFWLIISKTTNFCYFIFGFFFFFPQMGGEHFYIYVWGFMFVFSVFMMTIVPVFIMPLFNKYEPLPDSDLKRRIYELAEKLNYPLKKLFVMDGSKRSSHSNAFMFGFGNNKRIGKLFFGFFFFLFYFLNQQIDQEQILRCDFDVAAIKSSAKTHRHLPL